MPGTPPDRPDEMLGEHYRIERELGHGGMANVYLCEDIRDESRVAVKVLRPELVNAITRERFSREIAFSSELDHPRIPKVLESGTTSGGLPYYSMNFIDGESLRDRLLTHPRLPLDEARRITVAIAGPMGYAHERTIVHRDIKPDNILLSGDKVYVLDFGVARAIAATGDRLTRTGITLGTPAYMSPEQVMADQDLDLRSDIYSLACVVYEMLAGTPPFTAGSPQMLMAARFTKIPKPLSSIRDDVPESVANAIDKAMARKPADRWQTVDAFADAMLASEVAEAAPAEQVSVARPDVQKGILHQRDEPAAQFQNATQFRGAIGSGMRSDAVTPPPVATQSPERSAKLSQNAKIGLSVAAVLLLAAITTVIVKLLLPR